MEILLISLEMEPASCSEAIDSYFVNNFSNFLIFFKALTDSFSLSILPKRIRMESNISNKITKNNTAINNNIKEED